MFYDTHAPDTPTDVIPAAGAVVSNPITVSGRYSEFWGWGGYLLFVVNNTAGQQVTAVWKPLPNDPEDPTDQLCSGCVGTTTLPNLANGTYDVLTYAYDGGLSAPVVRRITVIDGPTTTTSSSTTTSSTTTVPPTTTSSSTTTMVPPTTTTTLPPTTTTAPTSSTSTTTSTTLPPPGVPSEPTSITVSDPVRRNGAGEVTVSWTPPSDLRGSEIIGYTILPSDNCTCTGIHVTDTSTSSSRLTGLALGVTYRFRVQASSNHGPGDISALSDQVTINPPVVRVMTWNLQRGIENSPFGPVVRAGIGVWAGKIREHRVQVVGLQEVTHDQAYDLASELGWYAYYKTTEAPCGDVFAEFPPECVPFGNAILSEFPFTAEDEAFEDLPNSREEAPGERKLLRIKVVIEGVQFHFYSTHLAAHPVGNTEEGDFDRNTQANAVVSMTEVDRQAAESGGGGLPYRGAVLGDFNSSPDDDASETMGASFVDAWDDLYERYDPAGYTSNARTGLRQRIDYIYVSRAHPWPVLAVTVDPEVLSDHLAVIAEL
jgi:endonuclease/exonuclease/phosphatase family metal-dependent hydrolase